MISVITPVYNGERFIEACIKIVIEQNCPDVEHIIVDGGSTDGTVEIIRDYAEKYSHIRWISEKDKGQSDAMNKGIAMAQGHIVSFLNVDDFYEPNILNRVLELFQALPEPSLLVGNCKILDDDDQIKYINKPEKLKITTLLLRHSPFPLNPSAYFYHKSLHQRIGLYNANEHYMMDLDFLIHAVQAANTKYVDELWGNHRQISGTKTASLMQSGHHVTHLNQLLEEHKKKLPMWQRLQMELEGWFHVVKPKIAYYLKHLNQVPGKVITKLLRTST
ncbi:MAG: glycosyltransferase [Cyanobacteria bacterium CRU_2_1]|nr:glycosyltransferase [Cyanobacteria bacterium CRU_2_1]